MPQQLQTHSALTGSPPPEPPDPASAGRKKQWLWVAALLVVAFGLVGWQVYGSYAKARPVADRRSEDPARGHHEGV
ncbi:MAG: hypothetical protein HYU66_26030 [Armatimonadetes bacterium]|nr:hypothetical protein [Armatimonadota bacterium]